MKYRCLLVSPFVYKVAVSPFLIGAQTLVSASIVRVTIGIPFIVIAAVIVVAPCAKPRARQ